MKKLELVGQRFGRLLVFKEEGRSKHGRILWKCLCSCGNSIVTSADNLRRGLTKSCGCLVKKHEMSKTLTYKTWISMIQRCNNSNASGYLYYGGRGITVCDSWLKFENFFEDMGERPDGLTIERTNNNKGYCPNNCKWATHTEQNRNKRAGSNNQSGVIGVHYDNYHKKYRAVITIDQKNIHLGYFKDKQKAINARKQAEKRHGF